MAPKKGIVPSKNRKPIVMKKAAPPKATAKKGKK